MEQCCICSEPLGGDEHHSIKEIRNCLMVVQLDMLHVPTTALAWGLWPSNLAHFSSVLWHQLVVMCFGGSNKEWKVKLNGYMKYLHLCVKKNQTHNAGCWDPETVPSDPAGTPLWQQTESPRVGSSAPQTGPWLNPMRGGFCSPGRCLLLRQKGTTHFINV